MNGQDRCHNPVQRTGRIPWRRVINNIASPPVVVAAFVLHRDSVLLCRRSSGGSQGLWELPGGKLEPDETPREGLLREIQEELSLPCEPGRLLYDGVLPVDTKQFRFMVFETIMPTSPVASTAHDLLAWVRPDQLPEYALAPLDVPVLAALMDKFFRADQAIVSSQSMQDPDSRVQASTESKSYL